MNKRHYEHTLPNIRGSLSNTYKITNRGIKISKEKKAVPEKTGATITIYCSLS